MKGFRFTNVDLRIFFVIKNHHNHKNLRSIFVVLSLNYHQIQQF